MRRLITTLGAVALAALSLAGCVNDPVTTEEGLPAPRTGEGGGDEVTVYVTLQIPGAGGRTRGISATQEEAVNFVDILVFDDSAEHTLIDWQYGLLDRDGSNNPTGVFSAKLRASGDANEKFRIMALANVRDLTYGLFGRGVFESTYKGVADYDDVCALLKAAVPSYSALSPDGKGFPMWGELENDVVVDRDNSDYDMTLLRSLARIDVGTNPDDSPAADQYGQITGWKALSNFSLEEVYLYNASTEYALAARGNYDFDTEKVGTFTLPSTNGKATGPKLYSDAVTELGGTPVNRVSGKGVSLLGSIYTGEADVKMNNGAGTYGDGNHPDRMAIVVAGYYSPDTDNPNTTKLSYYRLDFTSGTDGTALMDILRNNDYQMIIKSVNGSGSGSKEEAFEKLNADMTVVVRTWSNAVQRGTTIDGEYYLSANPYDFEIDKWGRTNQTVEIKTNAPLKSGKRWSAEVADMSPANPADPSDTSQWIELNPANDEGAGTTGNLLFSVEPVPDGSDETFTRSAKLRITTSATDTGATMEYDINVVQTGKDGAHLLRLSHSELVFIGRRWDPTANAGAGGWVNPEPQSFNVNWGPQQHDYSLLLSDYTGGGVDIDGMTVGVAQTSDQPQVTVAPLAIPDTDEHLASQPFYTRSSRIAVSAKNADETQTITKVVTVRQIYHSLIVDGTYDYYFKGREYSFNVKSNASWTASTDNSGFFSSLTTSGTGDTNGQSLAFTVNPSVADGATGTITISSPDTLFPPQTFTILAQEELPNSYVVAPGSAPLMIPVKKAYHVWELDPDLFNNDGTTLPTGMLDAHLVWQGEMSLIRDVSFVPGASDREGHIRVEINDGSTANPHGNAVVAFTINGEIWWSWHVWVTDYNPNDPAIQKHSGGYVLMDRNMGATSATPGEIGTYGLYYAWGRKDPMTSPADHARGLKPRLDIDNNPIAALSVINAPESGGLQISLHNPATFLIDDTWGSQAWTGLLSLLRGNLWGYYEKSDFDPCPQGWRVVQHDFFNSLPAVPPAVVNRGVDFGTAGFFPCSEFLGLIATGFSGSAKSRPLYAFTEETSNNPGVKRIMPGIEMTIISNSLGRGWSLRCMKDE